ncbi:hypothetical protein FJ692_07065 [Pseudomonas fluorescens]|nr:hypothetical protein C1751_24065 [Pseudomonas fluorescens]TPV59606.1 hypothetical protein FJ692_07065 [Pseudomonas fluorescens]
MQRGYRSLWERACSRKRWVSQHKCLLSRRLREQARSHTSVGHTPDNPHTPPVSRHTSLRPSTHSTASH